MFVRIATESYPSFWGNSALKNPTMDFMRSHLLQTWNQPVSLRHLLLLSKIIMVWISCQHESRVGQTTKHTILCKLQKTKKNHNLNLFCQLLIKITAEILAWSRSSKRNQKQMQLLDNSLWYNNKISLNKYQLRWSFPWVELLRSTVLLICIKYIVRSRENPTFLLFLKEKLI